MLWRWINWCRKLLEINKYKDSSYGVWRRVVGREVFDVSEDPTALIFVVKRCKKNILVATHPTLHGVTFQKFSLSITTAVITTDFTTLNTLRHWRSEPKFDLETCRIRTRGGDQLTATTFGRVGTAVVCVWLRIAWKTQCGFFCCHCQGRRCLILVPPLREQQIFQKCWDVSTKLYSAVPLKTATYVRKTNKTHTFLNNLLQLNSLHISNK